MTPYLTLIDTAVTDNHLSAEAAAALKTWLTDSAYSEFMQPLSSLIDAANWHELEDAFYAHITVGTGGIRGPVGIGPNRINRRTIGEAAQALSQFMESFGPEALAGGVVVGHEVRRQSREFAEYCCAVFAANGIKAYLFEGYRSTPELSFAIRHLGVTAGVQITASHNPRTDNGFKFYWSDGGQVVPPLDAKFKDYVSGVTDIKALDYAQAQADGQITLIGPDIDDAYLSAVRAQSVSASRSARIVFSPMHGAGTTNVLPVLETEGFDVQTVPEQLEADGDFPTAFGTLINPEFPEVMEYPRRLAEQTGADVAIMSDPDADRLSVGVKPSIDSAQIQLLSGNEIGIALTDFILNQLMAAGRLKPANLVLETYVTTSLIGTIARSYGVTVRDDLPVGFKFIGEIVTALPDPADFVFAAEESLGYLRGDYARDKDGAVAALMVAELASWLKDQNRTIVEYLDELYAKHGYIKNHLEYLNLGEGRAGKDGIRQAMVGLRDKGVVFGPDLPVVRIDDRLSAAQSDPAGYVVGRGNDQLTFVLSEDGLTRVTVRPSGTEPVIKAYTQVYVPVASGADPSSRQAADVRAAAIEDAVYAQLHELLGGKISRGR